MDREDLGSWLSGPKIDSGTGSDLYPGERLGLVRSGRGSVAGWGQRLGAITVDWLIALGVTIAVLGTPEPGDQAFSLVVLGVFSLMYVSLLLVAQRTFGMAVFGLRVLPVGSSRLVVWRVLVRAVLLALVIPAVIYDRDRRGLHDKAGRTVVARDR